VGEDAAAFDLNKQSLKSWGIFGVLLTSVLGAMYVVSIKPAWRATWTVHVLVLCQRWDLFAAAEGM
jgi:hypothetical protein